MAYKLPIMTIKQMILVKNPGNSISCDFKRACSKTSALAGVPTGRMKAKEQESVMGTRKSNGWTPSVLANPPATGSRMVAVAELLANSVKKAVIIEQMTMIPKVDSTRNSERKSPIIRERPDVCNYATGRCKRGSM